MRYAIVSDIHANLQAWRAVLRDIAGRQVDGIVCLGDVLGYGPQPVEVLESVHRHVDALVMGNHDAALCGKLDDRLFRDHARLMLNWTRRAVGPRAVSFLGSQPLVLVGDGFRCAHGDFAAPGAFNYVIDPDDAMPSWQAASEPLLFVGHSHLPAIFVIGASGTPHRLDPQDFAVEEGKRYLVNAGSVGYPRDADTRACYCLYDTRDGSIRWRRVPFDLDGYRAALAAANLPLDDIVFLDRDPLRALPPIREQLSFAPPTREVERVRDAVPEQDLARALRRKVTRWRVIAGLLLVAALGAVALTLAHRGGRRDLAATVPPYELTPRPAYPLAEPPANLLPPIPSAPVNGALPGWRYAVDDRERQAVLAVATNGAAHFVLRGGATDGRIRLEAAPVDLKATGVRKVCMVARLRQDPGFAGEMTLTLDLVCEATDGRRTVHAGRERKDFRTAEGEWLVAKKTCELLKDARLLVVAVDGRFRGTVEIGEITLTPVVRR